MIQATLREADVSPAIRRRWVRRVKNAQRAIGRLEDAAARRVRGVLGRSRSMLLGRLQQASPFDQWFLPQALGAARTAAAEYKTALADVVMDSTAAAKNLGLERTTQAAKALGIDVPAVSVVVPKEPLELATQIAPEFIQDEADDVLRAISREIRLSFAGGQTKAEMIRKVQAKLTKVLRFKDKRSRAETIVRTEVNRVHNAAHVEAMQRAESSNVKVTKRWVSSGDGRTRPEHRMMNGRSVGVDEKFPYPGLPKSLWPMYPLDPVLPPEASINCRCTVIEEFEVLDEADLEEIVA